MSRETGFAIEGVELGDIRYAPKRKIAKTTRMMVSGGEIYRGETPAFDLDKKKAAETKSD